MITLRDAKPEDAPALAAILGAWVADTPWMPKLHSPEQDLGFIGHLIATQDMRMSDAPAEGFLARNGTKISQLQVAQVARRRGVGQALVMEAQARTRHLTLWTHQANDAAIAFWYAMGFQETARTDGRDSEEKLPDIRFDLTAP